MRTTRYESCAHEGAATNAATSATVASPAARGNDVLRGRFMAMSREVTARSSERGHVAEVCPGCAGVGRGQHDHHGGDGERAHGRPEPPLLVEGLGRRWCAGRREVRRAV